MTDQPPATAAGVAAPLGRESVTGLILAGGQARRMREAAERGAGGPPMLPDCLADWQGWDKGLVLLGGQPLLWHAQRFLAPQVARLLISANRYLELYGRYGEAFGDDPTLGDAQGPLAGIATALARIHTPWLAVLPVDVPHPPADLFVRLAAALHEDGRARVAFASIRDGDTERDQPLCMLLHSSLQEDIRAFLFAGERRVRSWLGRVGALRVHFQGGEGVFGNINTPQDLAMMAGPVPRAARAPHRSQCRKS